MCCPGIQQGAAAWMLFSFTGYLLCELVCCYIYDATVSCWYGSTLQPLLKVRYVGGVTVSRLQPMLTQIYDIRYSYDSESGAILFPKSMRVVMCHAFDSNSYDFAFIEGCHRSVCDG